MKLERNPPALRALLTITIAVPAVLLWSASAARAATAQILDVGQEQVLRFDAGPGESNDVRVGAVYGAVVRLSDAGGSPVTPGAGCTSTSASEVSCPQAGIDRIVIALGDEGDRADLTYAYESPPVDVYGEAGDDVLTAGNKAELLSGGEGDDSLYPDGASLAAADAYSGGPGHDEISYRNHHAPLTITLDGVADDGRAGESDNVLADIEDVWGGTRDDTIVGTAADNFLFGDQGTDKLVGQAGADSLDPWLGCDDDELYGGAGDDRLVLQGRTYVEAGPGDDTIVTGGADCSGDEVFGEEGDDTADFSDYAADDIVISLDDVANDAWGEGDNFHSDIENLVASDYSGMVLIGSDGPNTLSGSHLDDVLVGGDGADTLAGGAGVDVVDYSGHVSAVHVSLDGVGNDGAADEHDNVAADIEDIIGGDGADALVGSAADNVIDGGAGADDIRGGPGLDAVDYFLRTGPVSVDLDGETGDDGEAGEGDSVGADVEAIFGGMGADTLVGNGAFGFVVGAEGDDRLSDLGGEDLFDGGPGDDRLEARDGAVDQITCGSDADTVYRDTGDNVAADCETVALVEAPAPPSRRPRARTPRGPITPPLDITDRLPPRATIAVAARQRLRTLLTRGVRVAVDCSELCNVHARLVPRGRTARLLAKQGLARGTPVARGSESLVMADGAVLLRATRAGRRALRRLRGGRFTVSLRVTDRAGNQRLVRQNLTLRR